MSKIYIMEPAAESAHLSSLSIDAMVVSASGDLRAYKAVKDLLHGGTIIGELYVLKFHNQIIAEDDPLFSVYTEYRCFGVPFTEIEIPDDKSEYDFSTLQGKTLLVDISGFSTPNLFRFMFIMHEIIRANRFHILYTEPKYYVFGDETYGSYEYFIGEREYRALDEFYVSGEDNRELLTIFLGFDRMTSSIVKDAVNPNETILVNGFPSLTPKLKDVSLLNNRELISVLGKPKFSVCTNNPFSSYNVLKSIQMAHTDMLMNVCVLGTKAMALGVGIYALKHRDVKLSYAFTKKHSSSFSIGADRTWYYSFEI